MYRIVSAIILTLLLLGSISAIAAFTVEDLGPRVEVLETQVSELRDLHGLEPTATPGPTATNTAVPPTATQVPPTATSEPDWTATPTDEPEACSVPSGASTWHAATNHEHGDAPPAWADDWSCEQFGHPVIYGGDEATPNENHHKHEAYKGYAFRPRADNGSYVDVYIRLHMQTNPHGRSAQYHSYEMYARDDQGAISFWQGWLDFGTAPGSRNTFNDDYLWKIIPDYAPANHIVGLNDGENAYYYGPTYSGLEFWYAQQSTPDGWEPVVIVDVWDPSTTTAPDSEHLTAMDESTWNLTGNHGIDRRVTLRWIVDGSTVVTASGQPYLDRNTLDPRGWFCATAQGVITASEVSGPDACGDALPQHIAPTMPTIGDTKTAAAYRDIWHCPECGVPN